MSDSTLRKADRVKLQGLVKKPTLNGWPGTVLAFHEGRYQIQLDGHDVKDAKRIAPGNVAGLHHKMPAATFVDIPQACTGRVDGGTGMFGYMVSRHQTSANVPFALSSVRLVLR